MEDSQYYSLFLNKKESGQNKYILKFPHVNLLNEGISYGRQIEMDVQYDLNNQNIIVPVK